MATSMSTIGIKGNHIERHRYWSFKFKGGRWRVVEPVEEFLSVSDMCLYLTEKLFENDLQEPTQALKMPFRPDTMGRIFRFTLCVFGKM